VIQGTQNQVDPSISFQLLLCSPLLLLLLLLACLHHPARFSAGSVTCTYPQPAALTPSCCVCSHLHQQ
jgi:hypothetical protein